MLEILWYRRIGPSTFPYARNSTVPNKIPSTPFIKCKGFEVVQHPPNKQQQDESQYYERNKLYNTTFRFLQLSFPQKLFEIAGVYLTSVLNFSGNLLGSHQFRATHDWGDDLCG